MRHQANTLANQFRVSRALSSVCLLSCLVATAVADGGGVLPPNECFPCPTDQAFQPLCYPACGTYSAPCDPCDPGREWQADPYLKSGIFPGPPIALGDVAVFDAGNYCDQDLCVYQNGSSVRREDGGDFDGWDTGSLSNVQVCYCGYINYVRATQLGPYTVTGTYSDAGGLADDPDINVNIVGRVVCDPPKIVGFWEECSKVTIVVKSRYGTQIELEDNDNEWKQIRCEGPLGPGQDPHCGDWLWIAEYERAEGPGDGVTFFVAGNVHDFQNCRVEFPMPECAGGCNGQSCTTADTSARVNSVDLSIGLGSTTGGRSAASLRIASQNAGWRASRPIALTYPNNYSGLTPDEYMLEGITVDRRLVRSVPHEPNEPQSPPLGPNSPTPLVNAGEPWDAAAWPIIENITTPSLDVDVDAVFQECDPNDLQAPCNTIGDPAYHWQYWIRFYQRAGGQRGDLFAAWHVRSADGPPNFHELHITKYEYDPNGISSSAEHFEYSYSETASDWTWKLTTREAPTDQDYVREEEVLYTNNGLTVDRTVRQDGGVYAREVQTQQVVGTHVRTVSVDRHTDLSGTTLTTT